ncbi:hypothetical protein SAMN06265795_12441 [Noviherbaspirillum humi]|uniref:Uncharacterized protein n=2 Tax=Noviherbaspirillum humi TaxID=1688639 RepID=A0A239LKZ8_9BURK|nr:hypothetical protein SAMN06265795_12441 [Noviherbaspirillum humi]
MALPGDQDLMLQLAHLPAAPVAETIKVDIENEYGRIYRILQTADLLANKALLNTLLHSRYVVVPFNPDDDYSVIAIVRPERE